MFVQTFTFDLAAAVDLDPYFRVLADGSLFHDFVLVRGVDVFGGSVVASVFTGDSDRLSVARLQLF